MQANEHVTDLVHRLSRADFFSSHTGRLYQIEVVGRAVSAMKDLETMATRESIANAILKKEVERLTRRCREAEELIQHAVELMTTDQLGQWAGSRAWLEAGDDEAPISD